MTAVAVELLPAPPAPDTLDPDAVELAADTDKLMVMCSCSASSVSGAGGAGSSSTATAVIGLPPSGGLVDMGLLLPCWQ
jgi:hypothetical protein